MIYNPIEQGFIDKVNNKNSDFKDDFKALKQTVLQSTATYMGEAVPFLYMPKFYTEDKVKRFENIATTMMALCSRVVDLYIEHEAIRSAYEFDKRLEAMILKPSPYEARIPMARVDIFDYGDDFMFCEINTDGTSAMNEDMVLASCFKDTKILQELSKTYDFKPFELFDTWVEEVKSIAIEANLTKVHPVLAIVDQLGESSANEFAEFKRRFDAMGFDTLIVDAGDLSYRDGLYYQGKKIDIVYRRFVTRDFVAELDKYAAFEQACLDDKTLIIGNIRSQVVHSKLFFKLLHDMLLRQHLTQKELEFIDAHVPKTYDMAYLKQNFDDFADNKDSYLLKPIDDYASHGVIAGSEVPQDEWREILRSHIDKDYLIQQYCPIAYTDNFDLKDDKLTLEAYKNITGMYVYNNHFYGLYARQGKNAIISGIHSGYTQPAFHYTKI